MGFFADDTELIRIGVVPIVCSVHNASHIEIELHIILLLLFIQICDDLIRFHLGELGGTLVRQDVDVNHTAIDIIGAVSTFDPAKLGLLQGIRRTAVVSTAYDCGIAVACLLTNQRDTLVVIFVPKPIQQNFVFCQIDLNGMTPKGVEHVFRTVHHQDAIFVHIRTYHIDDVYITSILVVHIFIEVGGLLDIGVLLNDISYLQGVHQLVVVHCGEALRMLLHLHPLPRMIPPVLFVKANQNVVVLVLYELCNDPVISVGLVQHTGNRCKHIFETGRNQWLFRILDAHHMGQLGIDHNHTRAVGMRLLDHQ